MVRALVNKELRETAPIALLALGVGLWAVLSALGLIGMGLYSNQWASGGSIPFVGNEVLSMQCFVLMAFALALGLRQTAWEVDRATVLFWYHLPVSRPTLLAIKLLVGGSLYLVVGLIPWLLTAVWASLPGSLPAPFYWDMTSPMIRLWLSGLLFYLGSASSGLSTGWWFGSRPLLAIAGLGFALFTAFCPILWIAGPVGLVAAVAFVSNIFWVFEHRDFG